MSRKRKSPTVTHAATIKHKTHNLVRPSFSNSPMKQREDSTPPRRFYTSLTIDVPDHCGVIEPYSTPSSARKRLLETSVGGIVLDSKGKGTLCGEDEKYSVCVHKGRRKTMQDCFVATTNNGNNVLGVFDGHGASGQQCASLCADTVNEYSKTNTNWSTDVKAGFQEAFQQAQQKSLQKIERGGSTACCAYVTKGKLWVANVGDSRCVLSRDGRAVPLSKDHKPDHPEERKRIESQGGQVVYYNGWRVEGVLSVSRSIGNKNLAQYLSAEADVKEYSLDRSDEFVILATDGLWCVVDSQRAVDIVREVLSSTEPADLLPDVGQRASEALVEEALNRRDSMDNICCVVAFLK